MRCLKAWLDGNLKLISKINLRSGTELKVIIKRELYFCYYQSTILIVNSTISE